jgi:hypothetical protein
MSTLKRLSAAERKYRLDRNKAQRQKNSYGVNSPGYTEQLVIQECDTTDDHVALIEFVDRFVRSAVGYLRQ